MSHEERRKLRNRGQTLVEFTFTLPILLLLVFGVVEFGRLFQAWVTIQNAAREATRYTTTGQYDEEKYILEDDIRDPVTGQVVDKQGLLPCWQEEDVNDPRTSRGIIYTHVPEFGDEVNLPYMVSIYAHPNPFVPGESIQTGESLFATWYDGTDCDPGVPDHLEWRKDILRMASIYDVARRGASGLSLEASRQNGSFEDIQEMLFGVWDEPIARSDLPGYFNVTVCSSRAMIDSFSTSFDPTIQSRFKTVGSDVEIPSGYPLDYVPPFCMLNESRAPLAPGETEQTLRNEGIRWMDPGGPGDRVTIFVTFNHPLITPLPLADYLTITARRSGVNESFRAARALSAVQGAPPGQGQPVEFPTLPTTNTPIPPPTITPIPPTNTPVPPTDTPAPGPFTCDQLELRDISFYDKNVYFEFVNHNGKPSKLERVYLSWRTPIAHPGMYMAEQIFGTDRFWEGNQPTAPFDTALLTGDDLDRFLDVDRIMPGASAPSYWEALYLNGGNNIGYSANNNPDGLTEFDFAGSIFYFLNPDTGGQCELRAPEPDPNNPTETPTPDVNASPTYTPDCASSLISVEFVAFRTFGVIELRVINNRYRPSPFLGFELNWPDYTDLPKIGGPNIFNLAQIKVGGNSVNDTESLTVWQGPDFQSSTTEAEGTWNPNYVFPQRSITSMFLDFDGIPGRLDESIDFGLWMLSGRFDIGCYDHGTGGSGPGNVNDGSVFLDAPSPPPPTNTPRPTNTPGPTLTPSPTRPTNTPSRTPTPGPTRTPRPTNTATIEVLVPPTAIPTSAGTGGGQ